MNAPVVPLRPGIDVTAAAQHALAAVHRHLDRCKLSANTVKAYRRQSSAYVAWLAEHGADHDDAFADLVGAEAAVTADAAQVQALLGHTSLETTARYFRAGPAEQAVVDRVFT